MTAAHASQSSEGDVQESSDSWKAGGEDATVPKLQRQRAITCKEPPKELYSLTQ